MRHALSLALARGPNSRWQSTPFPIEPARRGCKCRLQSATFVLKSTPQPARNFCRSAASLPAALFPAHCASAVSGFLLCLPHTGSALSWLESSPLDPFITTLILSPLSSSSYSTPPLPHPSVLISASSFLPHSRLPRYHLPRRLWLHRRPLVAIAFAATTTRRLVCCLSAASSHRSRRVSLQASHSWTAADNLCNHRISHLAVVVSVASVATSTLHHRIASHQPLASRNNLIVLITINMSQNIVSDCCPRFCHRRKSQNQMLIVTTPRPRRVPHRHPVASHCARAAPPPPPARSPKRTQGVAGVASRSTRYGVDAAAAMPDRPSPPRASPRPPRHRLHRLPPAFSELGRGRARRPDQRQPNPHQHGRQRRQG